MSLTHLKIAKMLFPFDFKAGQEQCLESLTTNPHNLWQAQTGFGKTLLSLCATIPYLLDPQHPLKQIIVFVRTKTQIFRFFEDVKKVSDQFMIQKSKIHTIFNINPYLQQIDTSNPFFTLPLVSKMDLCILDHDEEDKKIDCRTLECSLFGQKGPSFSEMKRIKTKFLTQPPQSSQHIISHLTEICSKSKCPYYTIRHLLDKASIVVTTQAWLYEPLRNYIEK
jgi:Rad3-related DNA helicase